MSLKRFVASMHARKSSNPGTTQAVHFAKPVSSGDCSSCTLNFSLSRNLLSPVYTNRRINKEEIKMTTILRFIDELDKLSFKKEHCKIVNRT